MLFIDGSLVERKVREAWAELGKQDRGKQQSLCNSLVLKQMGAARKNTEKGWDIEELAFSKLSFGGTGTCKAKTADDPAGSVTVFGKCYRSAAVNYYLYGLANQLCDDADYNVKQGLSLPSEVPWTPEDVRMHTLNEILGNVEMYRTLRYLGVVGRGTGQRGDVDDTLGITQRKAWTRAGYFSDYSKAATAEVNGCTPAKKGEIYKGRFRVHLGNAEEILIHVDSSEADWSKYR